MTHENCPDAAALFDYAVGRLSDAESDVLAAHLDACPICQAELETVEDADDTLVRRLRQPLPAEPYSDESHCHLALARAKAVAGRPGIGAAKPGDDPSSTQPDTLGEYRLLKRLGRGGMGTVYQALHTKLDRVVALKVLPKGRLEDRQAVARFEREMKAVGRLDHPNIVQAYDAREIDDMPVLVMQYVEGRDLGQLVRRLGRLSIADACELARQAALALQYAHEHGLVHRDVKPSNLMLTRRGELKLLDLGLARFYLESPPGGEVTDTGQTMGTADYMAPEQVSSSRQVDIRADVYSLGCTLYKLLSGRSPFSGPEYPGKFEKMTAHVERPVPPIRELVPEVPAALAGLLDRMLAKEPDGRPATPGEVAELLEPFCRGHRLPELAKQADGKAAAVEEGPAKAQPADAPPCPAPSTDGPRSIWLSAAIGLMLLSFLVGLAVGIVIRIEPPWGTVRPGGDQLRAVLGLERPEACSVPGLEVWEPRLVPGLEKVDNAFSPCLSPDLRTLIFSQWSLSEDGDDLVDADLMIATREDVSLPFDKPELMETTVTVDVEVRPALSPDGLELIFQRSDWHPRLLRCTRQTVFGEFGKPVRWEVPGLETAGRLVTRPQFIDHRRVSLAVSDPEADTRSIMVTERTDRGSPFESVREIPFFNVWPIYYIAQDESRAYFGQPDGLWVGFRSNEQNILGDFVKMVGADVCGPVDGPLWVTPQEDVIFYCSPGPGKKTKVGGKIWMFRF